MTYDEWRHDYSQHGMLNEAMAKAAWGAAVERSASVCETYAASLSDPRTPEEMRRVALGLARTIRGLDA